MKKTLYSVFILFCVLLSACSYEGGEEQMTTEERTGGKSDENKGDQEDTPAVAENEIEENEGYVEVVDETGVSRQLKLGDIEEKDVGCYFGSLLFASDYSQVSDGHYYYLRTDGSENYTIYRDKGEKVVCFTISEDYYVENFVKYGERFYAFLRFEDFTFTNEEWNNVLVSIDAKTGKVTVIKDMKKEAGRIGLRCPSFYQGWLYYEDHSEEYGKSVGEVSERGMMKGMPLNGSAEEKYFPLSSKLESIYKEDHPMLNFIDGKIYYGEQQKKAVTLYSYDLESDTEEEVFCYKRPDLKRKAVTVIKIDKDYIYCQDYIIPRAGGKMHRTNAKKGFYSPFSFNGNYIFYIDMESRVHRLSRDLQKDVVICDDIKAVRVDCTEKGIYIQEYNKAEKEVLEEDDEDFWDWCDPRSNNLYYMDFDGKHREKIWKEIVKIVELETE